MEPKLPPNDPDPVLPGPGPDTDDPSPDVYPVREPGGPMLRRRRASRWLAIAVVGIFTCACQTTPQQRDAERARAEENAKSAAYKAGEEVRHLTTEAERASKKAAQEIDDSAHKAKEGWEDQKRKDQATR